MPGPLAERSAIKHWRLDFDIDLPGLWSTHAHDDYSKNAPHLESAITLGVFVQMFAAANCSGGTPQKSVK